MPLISDQKGGVGEVAEAPIEAAAEVYSKTSPGYVGFVGAFNRAENPVSGVLLPRAEQSQFRENDWFRDFLNSATTAVTEGTVPPEAMIQYQPSPKIAPEEANKQYPNPDPNGKPLFNEPIEQRLAETIQKQKTELYQAQTDISRFESNHSVPVNMIASIPAMLTDPMNVALAFVPGVGEEAFAARLGYGAAARTAGRLAVGAELGVAQQAPISALKLGFADDLHSDYSIRQALTDTLMGAAAGAGLNAAIGGAVIDPIRYLRGTLPTGEAARAAARIETPAIAGADATTNHAAAQSAVAQIVTGRPVDVADFFPKPPPTETAVGTFLNHPFFTGVKQAGLDSEAVDLGVESGVSARELARENDPKLMQRVEELETQKQQLSDRYTELDQQRRQAVGQGQDLVVDQIKQLETQLQGKLSKSRRAQLQQRLSDLEDTIKGLPAEAELRDVQQKMQEADYALRDLAPQLSEATGRAQKTIDMWTMAEQGRQFGDLLERQKQFLQGRDFTGTAQRQRAWLDTGTAPGISHPDLVTAIGETERAAAAAPHAAEPTAPPEGWGNPAIPRETPQEAATGPGTAPAATPATKPAQPSQTGLTEAFGSLGGGGTTGQLYQGLFESLRQGRDTYAGVKDPVLTKAKAAYETGLVKNADDLRSLVQAGYDVKRAGLVEKPATFAEAYPDMDATTLSPEERAQLMDAHRELEAATNKEAGYEQAAYCLKGG